jgi:hypothetical protein
MQLDGRLGAQVLFLLWNAGPGKCVRNQSSNFLPRMLPTVAPLNDAVNVRIR